MLEGRINCSMLAQLLSAVGAIGFFWLLGRGVASRFRAGNGPRAVLYDLAMPLVTLGVVAIAYLVLQRPIAPLLDDALSSIYTWCFVLGTCACAVWLSMAVFSHAEALRKLLHNYRRTGVSTVD